MSLCGAGLPTSLSSTRTPPQNPRRPRCALPASLCIMPSTRARATLLPWLAWSPPSPLPPISRCPRAPLLRSHLLAFASPSAGDALVWPRARFSQGRKDYIVSPACPHSYALHTQRPVQARCYAPSNFLECHCDIMILDSPRILLQVADHNIARGRSHFEAAPGSCFADEFWQVLP